MEIKFDLTIANWLAYVVDPATSFSKLGFSINEKEMLKLFLRRMTDDSLSFINAPEQTFNLLEKLLQRLESTEVNIIAEDIYSDLRYHLRHKQWIACIIPSGVDADVDRILCEPELLSYLVKSTADNQGLVLQLDSVPSTISTVLDVHKVLRTALNDIINWPGILVWYPGGDSIFLPVNSLNSLEIDVEARIQWVFSKLFSSLVSDLGRLRVEYHHSFPEVLEYERKIVHILQLSDLNVGSCESAMRLPRIEQIIRQLVEELGENSKIVPIITGNLMDNPSEIHLNQVQQFWSFISSLGTEEPLFLLGENDVRKDGQINESYQSVVGFPITKIVWHENEKIAFVCINSVSEGVLNIGSFGEEQLADIEFEIERKQNFKEYKFVMLLHHPFGSKNYQDEVTDPFYAKVSSDSFSSFEDLKGEDLLDDFVQKYNVSAVFHGHQNIPSINVDDNVLVVGCGHSNGSISKADGSIYFSVNISSINQYTQKISSRLLMERKPDKGLVEDKRHEIIYRAKI